VGVPEKEINTGSGIIIDSGTTDTYLPSSLLEPFKALFASLTGGMVFHNNGYQLTDEQIQTMPDIVFTVTLLEDEDSLSDNKEEEENSSTSGVASSSSPKKSKRKRTYELVMPVTSYADIDGKGRYVFRVYFTESSGGVLGSNFMNRFNIIFDSDGQRLGFAQSTCNYDQHIAATNPFPGTAVDPMTPPPILEDGPGGSSSGEGGEERCVLKPLEYCTASCSLRHAGKSYVSTGNQSFLNECTKAREEVPCQEFCHKDNTLARGVEINCLSTPWTECDTHCKQYRTLASSGTTAVATSGSGTGGGSCERIKQERDCHVDDCPLTSEDFFILSEWKYKYPPALPPGHWEKLYEEDLFTALAQLLKV
jgi:hypothetical protein